MKKTFLIAVMMLGSVNKKSRNQENQGSNK